MNWDSFITGVVLLVAVAAFWPFFWITDLTTSTPQRFAWRFFVFCIAVGIVLAFGITFIVRAFFS